MGNSRPTPFASGLPYIVTPPPAVPPPTPSIDPVMSALAQMMSKLTEVSDRLDRVEGDKAQCSDASINQGQGKRVEFSDQLPSQPLANPWNLGQASSSRTHNVNQVRIDNSLQEAHLSRAYVVARFQWILIRTTRTTRTQMRRRMTNPLLRSFRRRTPKMRRHPMRS